jgi:hypothetical protein
VCPTNLPEDVDELLEAAKESATGGDGLEVVSRVREFTGVMRWIVMGLAFSYSAYYLYTARFGIQSPEAHRGYYWGFAGVLVFLLYPATKRGLAEGKRHRINPIDLVLSVAFGLLAVYFVVRYPIIVNQGGFLLDYQYYLGWAAILLSLEATRRVVGMALPAIATFFLFYAFYGPSFPGILAHRGLSQERVLSTMYTSFNGIFGPVAAIFATFVFLFIIFGAFLQKSGAGRFFIDLPFAIAGLRPRWSGEGRGRGQRTHGVGERQRRRERHDDRVPHDPADAARGLHAQLRRWRRGGRLHWWPDPAAGHGGRVRSSSPSSLASPTSRSCSSRSFPR